MAFPGGQRQTPGIAAGPPRVVRALTPLYFLLFQLVFLEFFEALLSFALISVPEPATKFCSDFPNDDLSVNKAGSTDPMTAQVTDKSLELTE